jgi:hypothetical protein
LSYTLPTSQGCLSYSLPTDAENGGDLRPADPRRSEPVDLPIDGPLEFVAALD